MAGRLKWRRIRKEAAQPPAAARYADWREYLAEESKYQCVYCAVPESEMGGSRGYHIEHYRPRARFPELANEYSNLFYACCICNLYKSDDWPRDPDATHSVIAYPNPAEADYSDLFDEDSESGRISARFAAAAYLLERLHLNRPQLIVARKCAHQRERLRVLNSWIAEILARNTAQLRLHPDLLLRMVAVLTRVSALQNDLSEARPYGGGDLRNRAS